MCVSGGAGVRLLAEEVGAALEEQRGVEDDERGAAEERVREELPHHLERDRAVRALLEHAVQRAVAEDERAQRGAVDVAVRAHDARVLCERCDDPCVRRRSLAEDLVRDRVRVHDRDVELAHALHGCRLAARDAAREPDHTQARPDSNGEAAEERGQDPRAGQ